jgi:hypothetical protein
MTVPLLEAYPETAALARQCAEITAASAKIETMADTLNRLERV